MGKTIMFNLFFVVLLMGTVGCSQNMAPINNGDITLPSGFKIDVYAPSVKNARGMALGPNGTLFVGSRSEGKVYAIVDTDNDHKADTTYTIAEGYNMPVGVAFKDGALYFSAVDKIYRLDDIEQHLANPPAPILITDQYPNEDHHGWKYIAFGPDGYLYVPVGAPCNICNEDDPIYASITRLDVNTGDIEIVQHGIRNTVGFDWDANGKLWFTDNGRDWLGDDSPPCELNFAPDTGMHFGYPFCHAGDIQDPEFGDLGNCADFTPPAQKLGPHVAPLGMEVYKGSMFPAEYQGQVFIAEHGSWNRSTKIGYRITLVRLQNGEATTYEPFAEGWLKDGEVKGRPVDLLVLPDGSMLMSDDHAGKIYRISYGQ